MSNSLPSVVLARFPACAEAYIDDVDVELDVDVACDSDESPPARVEGDTDLPPERTRLDASPGELFLRSRAESDQQTWARLVELADAAGNDRLAAAFRSAFDDERRLDERAPPGPRPRVPSPA